MSKIQINDYDTRNVVVITFVCK